MSALRSKRRLVGLSTRSFPRPFTIYELRLLQANGGLATLIVP